MGVRFWSSWLWGIALILLIAGGVFLSHADVNQVNGTRSTLPETVVSRVIDGDTIELVDGTTVRYIGINAPEMNTGTGKAPACLAQVATDRNKALVEGQAVRIEYDTQRTDQYGRTLAYIWFDSQLVNQLLVAEGLASTMTVPPNVKYADQFLAAEQQARTAQRGLWAPGACP